MKRSTLPLRFGKREWKRMEADAARWGWRWAIASVNPGGELRFLDPAKVRQGKEMRLGEEVAIDNVLRWIDS